MTTTTINRDLFRKVADKIEANPRDYYQGDWHRPIFEEDGALHATWNGEKFEGPPCGSACCVAGHVLIEGGQTETINVKGVILTVCDPGFESYTKAAGDLLGLPIGTAIALFSAVPSWVDESSAVNGDGMSPEALQTNASNTATVLRRIADLPDDHALFQEYTDEHDAEDLLSQLAHDLTPPV